MRSMVLFELDLSVGQMIFPQPGFLSGFIQSDQTYAHDAFMKRLVDELVYPEDRERVRDACQFPDRFAQNGHLQCEFRLRLSEDTEYQWVILDEIASHNRNRIIGTIENINQQKLKEEALKFQIDHDPLTGQLNRSAFHKAVDAAIQEPEATGMYAFLDIDDFKKINDTLGHKYGDWLLQRVCAVLRDALPEKALLGRYGGDEFILYIPGAGDREEAERSAQRVLDAVAQIKVEDRSLSVSLGVALYPQHGASWENGIEECADAAMYEAKAKGKSQFCIYNASVGKKMNRYQSPKRHLRGWGGFGVWLRRNRSYAVALLVSGVLLTILFAALTVGYTRNLQNMVNAESEEYLEEISAQMKVSLVKGMTGNYANLESLALKVEQLRDWPLANILADLPHEAEIFGYEQIALIDEKGQWVTDTGTYTVPALAPYLAQMKKSRVPITTPILSVFEEDCVVFMYPMPDIPIGDTRYIGVAAMADMNTLNNMLNLELFDGAGYSHVLTREGSVVIRSNHEDNEFFGYNLFTYLKNAAFFGNMTWETLVSDFSEGRSRKFQYELNGRDLMSIYVPVEYDDWYLFLAIPSQVLTEKTDSFYALTLLACGGVVAVFLLLLVLIFLLLMRGRQNLLKQLYTDPVTGGISKAKFELDAAETLNGAGNHSVLYANIDRFKLINEREGNKVGDELLRRIYEAIGQELETGELICRLMADHFGILLANRDIGFLRRRIEGWNRLVQEQAAAMKISTPIVMSYGILPVIQSGESVSLLLDKANMARKSAPAGSGIGIYDEALAERQHLESELESRQEQALENREFVAYFQPKYSPRTNHIVGAEALVRWITPDLGMIAPNQFIPLFESSGFISKVDLYIFEQSCRFIFELQQAGLPPLPISVNLSRFNLSNPAFLQDYVRVWSRYHIAASLIEFEITETLVYENMERLGKLLDNIHQYGFRVSMDDFGNGYSSLNMLKEVDIDVLKLDRDFFTVEASRSERAMVIVKRLIELAKDLGMQVVAEGVETPEMVDFLRKQDCDMVQGFYYSRPLPKEKLWARLKKEEERI